MIEQISPQKTLSEEVSFDGIGLHSGKTIQLVLKPAPENTGYIFRRVDMNPVIEIPALANFVDRTDRGTTLKKGDVEIQTTEHLLAALTGMSINNCIIEINGSELPILDGSSKLFVEGIKKAGVQDQEALQDVFVVKEILRHYDEKLDCEMMLLPADKTEYTVMIDFNTKVLVLRFHGTGFGAGCS